MLNKFLKYIEHGNNFIITLIGWAIWIIGTLLLFGIDYSSRIIQDDLYHGGIAELIYGLYLIVLTCLSIYVLYFGTKKHCLWLRALFIIMQTVIGFLLLVFASLLYVCNAGIDCI